MNKNELILGIAVFGHDSSVTLIDRNTGKVLYAMSEERFSNIKHDGGYPSACIQNIERIIKQEKLGVIEYVALNIDKSLFLDQIIYILKKYTNPEIQKHIIDIIKSSLDISKIYYDNYYPISYIKEVLQKNNIKNSQKIIDKIIWYGNFFLKYYGIVKYIKNKFKNSKIYEVPHHLCHVASSYYCSGFENAVAISIDGQGESETITLNYINDNSITPISKSFYPHSLGSLYMHLTWYLGFDGHPKYPGFTDEFKVMGMSAYGSPQYLDIFRTFGDVDSEGVFKINFGEYLELKLVEGCREHYQPVFTDGFYQVFGKRRNTDEPILQKHYDIALSFQLYLEEIGVKLAKYLKYTYPKIDNICLAGGVALNGLMNMKILQQAGFNNIFIQPASGDDGTSLGAALYTKFNILKDEKVNINFNNVYLGLNYHDDSIKNVLDLLNINYTKPDNIHEAISQKLNNGDIITRYFQRAEFGPRALGHRSILANPTIKNMKEIINTKIKHREPFRPFAPACLEEYAKDYFDINIKTPYMILICEALEHTKDIVPAVVHDDNSTRLQTVSKENNTDFYNIISEFNKLSDVPILINTSFNVNGEVIVETPIDAIESALFMDVDYLAIGSYLVSIEENKDKKFTIDRKDFLERRKQRYVNDYFNHELFIWTEDNPLETNLDVLHNQVKVYKTAADERLELINKLDIELKKMNHLI